MFLPVLWLSDFLKFPSEKSSKIFIAHRLQRHANSKHEKSRVCNGNFFSIFANVSVAAAKNWSYRFP